MDLNFWIIQTFNGVSYGALLFLLASGLSLIFGVMRIVNLAHGSFFLLGGYVALTVIWTTGSWLLALPAAALAIAVVGLVMERVFLRPLGFDPLRQVLLRLFGEQNRVHELEPIGVIDIGSNSVRLVVYEGAVRAPTPVFNEKVLCGLGRDIASTGKLGAEAVDRALAALTRFRSIARILEVKNVRAFATAAVREADDGAEFIARAEKALGLRIEVLSGEKEARLVAQGIMMGFVNPDGVAGDLGGGSLELIDIASDRLKQASTLPVGGLRLIDGLPEPTWRAPAITSARIFGSRSICARAQSRTSGRK